MAEYRNGVGRMGKTLRAALAVGIVVGVVMLGAMPAQAAEAAVLGPVSAAVATSRPVQPTPLSRWGMSIASLTGSASSPWGGRATKGGWINGPAIMTTGMDQYNGSVWSPSPVVTPSALEVLEPTYIGSPYNGLFVPVAGLMLKDNRSGAIPGHVRFTDRPQDASKQTGFTNCASTEWSESSTWTKRGGPAGYEGQLGSNGAWQYNLAGTGITAAQCPYVVSMMMYVCTWKLGVVGEKCQQFVWVAENAFSQPNGAYKVQDYSVALCSTSAGLGVSPDCPFSLPVNGTDFNVVCANPPAMAWLSWDWLPETVGFYGRCLFQPASGFDSASAIKNAWGSSSGGTIGGLVQSVGNAFTVSETCGVLMPASGSGPFSTFAIDTCGWSSWATPLSVVIGIWVTLAFGMWAVGFLIATISGVVTRKLPTPVVSE